MTGKNKFQETPDTLGKLILGAAQGDEKAFEEAVKIVTQTLTAMGKKPSNVKKAVAKLVVVTHGAMSRKRFKATSSLIRVTGVLAVVNAAAETPDESNASRGIAGDIWQWWTGGGSGGDDGKCRDAMDAVGVAIDNMNAAGERYNDCLKSQGGLSGGPGTGGILQYAGIDQEPSGSPPGTPSIDCGSLLDEWGSLGDELNSRLNDMHTACG